MIVARELTKQFGSTKVLRSLNVDIKRGRVTAIVGPNGAGKTTLIKCILGLTRPDSGTLMFDGASIGNSEQYRERIGYMPQIARFPENLTGEDFFSLLRGMRNASNVDEGLVDDFKLRGSLRQQLRLLSGGTKQKVNAAAAFMFAPDVLILDEPTSGLDPIAAGVMKARIRSERVEGRSIVITSHILSEIDELADDVVYLTEGGVRFSGSVHDLRVETEQSTLERAIATLMTRGEQ